MLPLPTGSAIVKFIGIDPGTKFPGLAIIFYDLSERKIVYVRSICLDLVKMSRTSIYRETQTERFLQLKAFCQYLHLFLRLERPIKVASEHPYINPRMPGAVIPLAECLYEIETTVYQYNPYMGLEKIDPSSIKKSVGVSGTSGDKHAMTEAIKKIPEIMNVLEGDIDTMNNNAVDAIAVAYCSLKRELESIT